MPQKYLRWWRYALTKQLTDEYIQEHLRELIMTGLSNYDEAYYKSDQYKENRGNHLMEKYK